MACCAASLAVGIASITGHFAGLAAGCAGDLSCSRTGVAAFETAVAMHAGLGRCSRATATTHLTTLVAHATGVAYLHSFVERALTDIFLDLLIPTVVSLPAAAVAAHLAGALTGTTVLLTRTGTVGAPAVSSTAASSALSTA